MTSRCGRRYIGYHTPEYETLHEAMELQTGIATLNTPEGPQPVFQMHCIPVDGCLDGVMLTIHDAALVLNIDADVTEEDRQRYVDSWDSAKLNIQTARNKRSGIISSAYSPGGRIVVPGRQ